MVARPAFFAARCHLLPGAGRQSERPKPDGGWLA